MLPYTDTKPQGAADFYFAINATFRFIYNRQGRKGWIKYLRHLAREYFHPVNEPWRQNGLSAVAAYWEAFFAAEPGARIEVSQSPDEVIIDVHRCPAIAHLKEQNREIVPFYCQHCYYLNAARASRSGLFMNLEGGNGCCRHIYRRDGTLSKQDLALIKDATLC